MLAVGTGIAYLSQVIKTILNYGCEDTLLQLLYGCRTYKDILCFPYSCPIHRLWVHVRTTLIEVVLTSTRNLCLRAKIRKNVKLWYTRVSVEESLHASCGYRYSPDVSGDSDSSEQRL